MLAKSSEWMGYPGERTQEEAERKNVQAALTGERATGRRLRRNRKVSFEWTRGGL